MNEMYALMQAEQKKEELAAVIKCNETTKKYGLTLTEKEAEVLMESREDSLKDSRRIEFSGGILPNIIEAFCDSQYINKEDYADILGELQEIFYVYKNESQDELTDIELLNFMRKQFDEVCFGDLDYLSGTCLERFARAIRSGYQCSMQHKERDEYFLRNIDSDYERLSEETRWEYEVYKTRLEDTY